MRSRRSSSRTTRPGRGRRLPRSSTARAWPSSGPAGRRSDRRLGRGAGHPRRGCGVGGGVHCRLRDAGPGHPHPAPRRAALGTGGWWPGVGWSPPTAGWARPKIARDHSRALTLEQIAALWRLDVGLREKTLWRLLYETAARASEILTLDIADLDRPGKRVRIISKGGDIDWVYYQTETALLLPRLLTAAPEDRCSSPSGPHPSHTHPGPVPRHRPGRRPEGVCVCHCLAEGPLRAAAQHR